MGRAAVTLDLPIDAELLARVESYAVLHGISPAELLADCLEAFLEQEKRNAEAEAPQIERRGHGRRHS